jgi:hypothetical protein
MKQITYTIGQGLDSQGKPIEWIADKRTGALSEIAHEFGGYTATIGKGGWIAPSGKLIEEPTLTITVLTDANETAVQTEARFLAAVFDQTSVMVAESDATVQFVEQHPVSAPIAPVSFPATRQTLQAVPIRDVVAVA